MTPEMRSTRTERLLSRRLDELASALERPGAPARSTWRMVELASVATAHAVTLQLLSSERAASIWKRALDAHPVLAARAQRRPIAA